jgi:hypothetical protein
MSRVELCSCLKHANDIISIPSDYKGFGDKNTLFVVWFIIIRQQLQT